MPRQPRKRMVGKEDENEAIERRERFIDDLTELVHRQWPWRAVLNSSGELQLAADDPLADWDESESWRDAS